MVGQLMLWNITNSVGQALRMLGVYGKQNVPDMDRFLVKARTKLSQ